MDINYSVSRVIYYNEMYILHSKGKAKAAIKAGEHLVKLRNELPKGIAWTKWIAIEFPTICQRNIYYYIDCYVESQIDPVRADSCTSIRELLGMSLAGKPARVVDYTKMQRSLLMVAKTVMAASDPKMEAQALIHAIMGTEPPSSAMHPLIADWITKLQLSPAIR